MRLRVLFFGVMLSMCFSWQAMAALPDDLGERQLKSYVETSDGKVALNLKLSDDISTSKTITAGDFWFSNGTHVGGGAGSQTPWTSNINAAGYNLTNVGDETISKSLSIKGDLTVGSTIFVRKGNNIGIGTSSPTQVLDVNGTVKANAYQSTGTGNTYFGSSSAANVGIGTATPAAMLDLTQLASQTATPLFRSRTNTGAIALYGSSAGNVGIGTTSPSEKLHVVGDWRLGDTLSESGTTAYYKGVQLNTGGSGSPGGADTQIQFNDGGSFGGDSGLVWDKTNNDMVISADISVGEVLYGQEHSFSMYVDGALSTDTTVGGVMFNDTGATLKILGAKASVGTAPTGSAIQVGVSINGANVTTTPITINAGTYVDAGTTVFNDVTLAANERLSFNLSKIGSTVGGADLWAKVRCKKVR